MLHGNRQSFFWSNTPIDEKSESDSDNPSDRQQVETGAIFDMDEMLPDVSSLPALDSGQQKCHKIPTPYGRLRHQAIPRITTEKKYDFPGDYIKCFSGGHLNLKIPGYSEPFLQIPDDTALGIKLSDHYDTYTNTTVNGNHISSSMHAAGDTDYPKMGSQEQDPQCYGRFSAFTAQASTDSEMPSHDASQEIFSSCTNFFGPKDRFWHTTN